MQENKINDLYEHDKIVELFLVLKNEEEQYSLWPEYKTIPNSWTIVMGPNLKEDCLNYIKENWIDMRPLSLRKKMKEVEIKGENKT